MCSLLSLWFYDPKTLRKGREICEELHMKMPVLGYIDIFCSCSLQKAGKSRAFSFSPVQGPVSSSWGHFPQAGFAISVCFACLDMLEISGFLCCVHLEKLNIPLFLCFGVVLWGHLQTTDSTSIFNLWLVFGGGRKISPRKIAFQMRTNDFQGLSATSISRPWTCVDYLQSPFFFFLQISS